MLTSAHITNFRGIESLTVDGVSRLNLFVGKNGVGKTSIMEAIALGATGGHPNYFNALAQMRGLPGFSSANDIGLTSYFRNKNIKINIDLNDGDKGRYITEVMPGNMDEQVTIQQPSSRSADSQNLVMSAGNTMAMETAVAYAFSYSHSKPKQEKHIRKLHLMPNGFQIPKADACGNCPKGFYLRNGVLNFAYANQLVDKLIRERKKDQLLAMLQGVIPQIKDIIPSSAQGPLVDTGDAIVPAQVMGGGFGWVLSIYSHILMTNGGACVAVIDEIESGLHRQSMKALWVNLINLLNQLPRLQIFCSTHSEELIEYALEAFQSEKDKSMLRIFRVMAERNGKLSLMHGTYDTIESIKESASYVS